MLILYLCVIWLCVESTVAEALWSDQDIVSEERKPQTSHISTGLSKRDSGLLQVSLSSDGGSYFSVIRAGNISFRVALDTASSDLWLLSSACSSSACKNVPSYPLSYSSPSFATVNNNQTTFNLSFADGSVSSGFLAEELIQLENFTLPHQVFGLVNSTNVTLTNEISGVLGLGFPRLSLFTSLATNATPFVNNLAQEGLLDYPFFGLSLTRNGSGSISLGAIDTDVVTNRSQIEWHKVAPFSPFAKESNSSSYLQWVLRLSSFGVNGSTIINPQPSYPEIMQQSLALLDVGTNGIFGPYQDVSRIFDAMDGARLVNAEVGQWAMPCDSQEVLSINFGRGNFTLQPTDYLIAPTSGDPNLCLSWPMAVAQNGDGIDWQLGTPFLRTVYSIFSYGIDGKETPMIGLYPLSNVSVLAENVTAISTFFASASTTAATTLPNSILSTVTPTVPSYIFNTSVPASVGDIVTTDLGTSTYSPLLNGAFVNATALPEITPAPTALTLILTDASGMIITSTSALPTTSIPLGKIPGQSSAQTIRIPHITFISLAFAAFITFVSI